MKDRVVLGVERQNRKSGGDRIVYLVQCETDGCGNVLKVRPDVMNTDKQRKCLKCQYRKRPFESIYNSFRLTAKRVHREVTISYEDFLEFTKIEFCEYCGKKIDWKPYATVDGKYLGHAYFLDRKDSSRDYSKDNIAVCCSECNWAKSNLYSYDAWKAMNRPFREGATEPQNVGNKYEILFGYVIATGNE